MVRLLFIITLAERKNMSIISTNLKELLARFAAGKLDDIPEQVVTPEIDKIIQDIYKAKQELQKSNVLSTAFKMHPEHINPVVSDDISDSDLLFVVENEHIKNRLIEFDLKLTDALTRQKDNPTFDWHELADNITNVLKPKTTKGLVFLDELSFESERVIASWGLPQLDKWLEGGITESSFTIFYGSSNLGKSTLVTVDLSAKLIAQGKTPLIIALEGSPRKFAMKIVATLAGCADKDPKDYTDEDKKRLIEISKSLPHIPIINKGCKKKWEIEKLIHQYKADIVIFDQLTISGNGRDWESMAQTCENLKQISIGLGIPVIALTQSSAKNYNGNSEQDEGDLSTESYIKYSQAVFEDATHVVEITKHDNSSQRGLTIRKTKDDNTTKLGPIRLIVELTQNGYVERYWRDGNGRKHEFASPEVSSEETSILPEALAFNPMKFADITYEEPSTEFIEDMKTIVKESSTVQEETKPGKTIVTECGPLNLNAPDLGIMSEQTWKETSSRLRTLPIYDKIADIFEANLPNMPQFGEDSNPSFLLNITDHNIPEAFRKFYD